MEPSESDKANFWVTREREGIEFHLSAAHGLFGMTITLQVGETRDLIRQLQRMVRESKRKKSK